MTFAGPVALVLASATGGTGRHVASLAEGLVAAGVPVSVFGPAATERRYGFAATGAVFRPVEIPAGAGPADVVAVRALRAALRGAGTAFAVVHAHGLRAGLVAALSRPAGTPLVVTWHNLVLAAGARGRIYHHLERYVARAAEITFVVSADLAARARGLGAGDVRLAAVPAPPLAVTTQPPEAVRAALGAAADQPVVLSVGRLHPQKGHDVLVDAAALWRDLPVVPLVAIAGDGPARADLAARIAATGAPVRLLGHRSDVADLLAAATVVVATSVWEGQPLLVQEALRAGAPLVATAVGGVPDVAGDAALLVAAGDVAAVDAAVRRLLADAALRQRYAQAGPRRAATWPDEAEATALVLGAYAELAAGNSAGLHR